MTIALERPVGTTDPATLVDPEVMGRLTARITKEHTAIDEPMARRIVAQTAAFLAASVHSPGQRLVPSKLVDIGWHTFILHTVDYAAFCDRVVGRFVHHVPETEADGHDSKTGEPLRNTVAALTAAGLTVDHDLWPSSADCGQCHAGCHDSPKKQAALRPPGDPLPGGRPRERPAR
ncbi:glycine-rich domain-containing protein [Streptomyces formicae]|uniref:Uncharacterized protein n=1 Tax=Streptomyces formicae TaxID=1616117 RepID=A0ABY3WTW3_9ACTN|nr:hypothetical protein [Streptomyces formicae]UNM15520.1 hypothetical protein J4032_32250 [Streptomyces formicae]